MFYSFLTQIPIQLLGIISGVFIARMIGPEGKGVFAIYQANAQLLATFFSLSFGNILTYFVPQGKIKHEKILGISFLLILFSSLLVLLLLVFFNFSNNKEILFPLKYSGLFYLLWLFLFSVLTIISGIATGFLQGLKQFNNLNRILILSSIINFSLFGLLFFLHITKLYVIGVNELLLCLLLIAFINIIQFVVAFQKNVKIIPSFDISFSNDVKPMLNYLFHTHLSMFVGFFNARLSLWILNYYLNETAIGLFSLASNLVVIFNMISAPIGNVLMPFLSSESKLIKDEMFYKYSKINFTILLLLGIFSALIASTIIPLIYGPDFKSSAILFQVLLPGILLSSVSRLYAVYIASCNKQVYNLYATLIGFFVNIVVNLILIKSYGTIGASMASTVTYLVSFLILLYYIHVKLKLPYGNYLMMEYKEIKPILVQLKSTLHFNSKNK